MHTVIPCAGSENADLIHTSQALSAAVVGALHAIPSLLFQPVWRAEHLKVLKVKAKKEVPTSVIVGKFNLPRDGYDDFEELASELSDPSISDILNFPSIQDKYRLNVFQRVFSDLHEISTFDQGQISQNRYVRCAKSAIQGLVENVMPYIDDEGSLRLELNSVPFHLQRIAVKGVLACDGCIIRTDVEGRLSPLPVATISVFRPQDKEDIEAQEASQLVLQAALAYEQNSNLKSYKVFLIHINRLRLQLLSADVPHKYLERLYSGEPCTEGFEISHSSSLNMLEVDGRRDALRVIFGLLKAVRTKPKTRLF